MENHHYSPFIIFLVTVAIFNFKLISSSPPFPQNTASPPDSTPSPPPQPFLVPSLPPPSLPPSLPTSPPPPQPLLMPSSPPSPPPVLAPSSTPPPPPPPLLEPSPWQINNIIDALIGAGDFTGWIRILSMATPMVLPVSATIFIPEDDGMDSQRAIDPFLFPYHIIPQRLMFSDLLLFKLNSRVLTLLLGNYIVVTSNSSSDFTIDGVCVTYLITLFSMTMFLFLQRFLRRWSLRKNRKLHHHHHHQQKDS